MAKFEKYLKEMSEEEFVKLADAAEDKFNEVAVPILRELAKYEGNEGTMERVAEAIRKVKVIRPD